MNDNIRDNIKTAAAVGTGLGTCYLSEKVLKKVWYTDLKNMIHSLIRSKSTLSKMQS